MFWFKTQSCTLFLFLQLIVRFELKSVLHRDNDENYDDVEESKTEETGASIKSLERQESSNETHDIRTDEINNERRDEKENIIRNKVGKVKKSNLASKENKRTMILNKQDKVKNRIKNKVENVEDLVDENEDDADEESFESQESFYNLKEKDGNNDSNIGIVPSIKTNESKKIAKNKVAQLEKFGIPLFNDSANPMKKKKNNTKQMSLSQGEKNDYALDDFWVDQPFDFYHYYQFTTPRSTTSGTSGPKIKKFALNTEKPDLIKKLIKMKYEGTSEPTTHKFALDTERPDLIKKLIKMKYESKKISPSQRETDDYALDDFWVDQPFDFYHYYQFLTTPRPTTVAPTPYYDEYYEYKDAYDYNREYSQTLIVNNKIDKKKFLKTHFLLEFVNSP